MLAQPAAALVLDLPARVVAEERRDVNPGSYALPVAPFDGTVVPSRVVEGALEQRAFQLDAPGMTTLAVLAPLRDQVAAAGFTVLLDCETRACGGFDFRFGTDVMPEPDMHVDMGDFRFLSAEKGREAISILVSRSANRAYVQVTRVNGTAVAAPSAAFPVTLGDAAPVPPPGDGAGVAAALDNRGSAVLEDLTFSSGAARLENGDTPSLAAVAAWLAAHPAATIALVGHTDASGSLAANIALSERRAEAAVQALVDVHRADSTRIMARGVGFLAPRATNQTEEGRQQNRRVEVVVTSTR